MLVQNPKARRMYFIAFAVLFIALIPVIVLYAMGYRIDRGVDGVWKVVETGGISLSEVPKNAEVYFEYQKQKPESLLNKSFFVQDLTPRSYLVVVARDGYWSWAKHLPVYEKRVTHASPFLIPKKPTLVPVQEFIIDRSITDGVFSFFQSTSTQEENPDYKDVVELFATSTPGTYDMNRLVYKDISLWKSGKSLFADWVGERKSIPEFLCSDTVVLRSGTTTLDCGLPIEFAKITKPPLRLDFFPERNDVVIYSTADGIFVHEIDRRPDQNIQPLFTGPDVDFRIDNETIYLKNKDQYFEVSL